MQYVADIITCDFHAVPTTGLDLSFVEVGRDNGGHHIAFRGHPEQLSCRYNGQGCFL